MAKLSDDVKALVAKLKVIQAKDEALTQAAATTATQLAALPNAVVSLTGLVKAYMAAVAKSDGLTSVRPATLKAVQTAEAKPSSQTVAAAMAELTKHLEDVKAKSKAEAKFPKFEKAMTDLVGKVKALIG